MKLWEVEIHGTQNGSLNFGGGYSAAGTGVATTMTILLFSRMVGFNEFLFGAIEFD